MIGTMTTFKNIGVPEKQIRKVFLDIDKFAAKYGWAGEWRHFTPCEAREWSEELSNLSNKEQEKQISNHFIMCYSKNNFSEIEEILSKWEKNPIFNKRMPIFRNCLFVLRNSTKSFNPSNLVVPILIIQIDGIMAELIEREGWKYEKRANEWKHPNYPKGNYKLRNSEQVIGLLIKNKRTRSGTTYSGNLIQFHSRYEMIIEGLFQRAQHGVKMQNLSMISRHKILHGEEIRYGTLENTIKLFLFLNYFSKFKISNLVEPDDSNLVELRLAE
ncbi:hypothetical protein [Methanoregula sp.]|uniref:hypothetical protein n=1 Tax=Methanoregula sp. TaxID=2052170 RepID=UPI003BAE2CCF